MKVGIVGCGHICEQHLRALRRVRVVVGVCDRYRDRAVSVAKAYQVARFFDNIDRMIDEAPIDVIHILTPPQSHREMAVRALEAGCHVLVEKPMAMNADEARDMLEVSRRRGRSLGVCHSFRFIPALIEAN